jgi:hypothetical protein
VDFFLFLPFLPNACTCEGIERCGLLTTVGKRRGGGGGGALPRIIRSRFIKGVFMLFCFCFYSSRHFSNINKKKENKRPTQQTQTRFIRVCYAPVCVRVCVGGGWLLFSGPSYFFDCLTTLVDAEGTFPRRKKKERKEAKKQRTSCFEYHFWVCYRDVRQVPPVVFPFCFFPLFFCPLFLISSFF